jgi:hypothetical protein
VSIIRQYWWLNIIEKCINAFSIWIYFPDKFFSISFTGECNTSSTPPEVSILQVVCRFCAQSHVSIILVFIWMRRVCSLCFWIWTVNQAFTPWQYITVLCSHDYLLRIQQHTLLSSHLNQSLISNWKRVSGLSTSSSKFMYMRIV